MTTFFEVECGIDGQILSSEFTMSLLGIVNLYVLEVCVTGIRN